MEFENLNPEQEAALAESLEVPEGQSLAEYLEECASDITFTHVTAHLFEVRTDDQGGEMTGKLSYEAGVWSMRWDFWTH